MKYLVKKNLFGILILIFQIAGLNVAGQNILFSESFDSCSAEGVVNHARNFDGFSDEYEITPTVFENPETGFSVEAWIAPQEFALNVAAIVDREKDFNMGYLFGIDNLGRLVGAVAVDGEWEKCVSAKSLPLLKWAHVVMSVSAKSGIQLFINGEKAGELIFTGKIDLCPVCKIVIGKTMAYAPAANTERATSQAVKTQNRFDGLIDELKIYDATLSENQIVSLYKKVDVKNPRPQEYRRMPSGEGGKGEFGAYYTQLKYSPGWDAIWRGSDFPDIVVRFPDRPERFVFWRGTGYIPAVVSENGIWMTDQSLENWGPGECFEAMGDKQARYSHVRIIENSPARVVIHWRYALASINHVILNETERGWGDWADEYWTIYPDGVAARKQVLWSQNYDKDMGTYQFQETIFFNQPGTKPQDNVEYEAITFLDLEGNKANYSWENGIPQKFDKPEFQPIQMVNFKSEFKPYSIYDPKRITRPFTFGNMSEYSTFPCWNHWPVQQTPSDGRNVVVSDKPSHSSLTQSNGRIQVVEKNDNGSILASSLIGMTNQPVESLLPLAKSWNFYPALKIISGDFQSLGYDKYQRSYQIKTTGSEHEKLEFQVEASMSSPVQNLAIVIEGFVFQHTKVYMNNNLLKENTDYMISKIQELDSGKTVVFIKVQTVKPLNFNMSDFSN